MEVKHGRGYVYALQYHIVWCVKYRHNLIQNQVEEKLVAIVNKIAKDNNFEILEVNSDLNHVHLLISCSPQHYIPDVVKALKGISARLLLKDINLNLEQYLWRGHLWNPSYFVATVSENTETQIREYIQNQKDKHHGKSL